jgi:hypothetical protein
MDGPGRPSEVHMRSAAENVDGQVWRGRHTQMGPRFALSATGCRLEPQEVAHTYKMRNGGFVVT